ncbi:MAG: DUF664 domain-containing protein [Actinobacteria bacterium]|nr:DUF664 domain-containing protein [Actinomycetota bacterium]
MNVSELLIELYDRVVPLAEQAVTGLDTEQLVDAPVGSNSIGWLIWHLARVQDDHLGEIMGSEQIWVSGDWGHRFGLVSDPGNIGYGHGPEDVAAVRPESAAALLEYLVAVAARTRAWLAKLVPDDLDQVVDHYEGDPITMGVRLVSVADDCLQHVGQANYIRGRNGW